MKQKLRAGFFFTVLVVGASAIGGCQTEQPATGTAALALAGTCQSYGFKPGTADFSACVFHLDQQRIAVNRQKRMAIAAAFDEAGAQISAGANAYRQPTYCTSRLGGTWVGRPSYVTTSCY